MKFVPYDDDDDEYIYMKSDINEAKKNFYFIIF